MKAQLTEPPGAPVTRFPHEVTETAHFPAQLGRFPWGRHGRCEAVEAGTPRAAFSSLSVISLSRTCTSGPRLCVPDCSRCECSVTPSPPGRTAKVLITAAAVGFTLQRGLRKARSDTMADALVCGVCFFLSVCTRLFGDGDKACGVEHTTVRERPECAGSPPARLPSPLRTCACMHTGH